MRGCEYRVRVFALFLMTFAVGHLIVDSLWAQGPMSSSISIDLNEDLLTALRSMKEELLTTLNCTAKVRTTKGDEYLRTGLAMRIAEKVKEELKQVNYWNKSLDGLLLDRGGTPLRALVIGHWRSGASFVGDLLQSHPGTYYAYEPLAFHLRDEQVRGGPLIGKSNSVLKKIFECRYKDADQFLNEYIREGWLFQHSRLLKECSEVADVCSNVEFLTKTCRLSPFQVFKMVRYRLDALSGLLQDKALNNLKVVYFIRDPRAIMNSRLRTDWCFKNKGCANATVLCEDLKREFYISQELQAKFSDRFMVLPYESIVKNYSDVTSQLFKFLGLEVTHSTVEFLRTHTSTDATKSFSADHNGKNTMHSMKGLAANHSLLKNIQSTCADAMKLWGYEPLEIGISGIENE